MALIGASLLALALAGCDTRTDATQSGAPDCHAILADLQPIAATTWRGIRDAEGLGGKMVGLRRMIERQLVTHEEWIAAGWCEYRREDFAAARRAFRLARLQRNRSADAATGLGFVALRTGEIDAAVAAFAEAAAHGSRTSELFTGLRLAVERLEVGAPAAATARDALRTALGRQPDDPQLLFALVAADRKAGGSGELRRRADAAGATLDHFVRTGTDYLEVRREGGVWTPLFVKGVNIGPALPGHFPSEAPEDEATWAGWLTTAAGLGINTVRVYTLLPPAFYRALATHNREHADRPLWLMQGVWAELPPDHDFGAPAYIEGFHREIARVIDAVHGDLVLAPERGNARGVYGADVSRYTLAWIVGREWEPFAVAAYAKRHPNSCSHEGRYVVVREGHAMECWVGETLDFAASYEARRYGQARALTFANWPTLDPLHHPTEATQQEEDHWRQQRFGTPIPARGPEAWDDDAISLDAAKMSAAAALPTGVFASYHIYPNFPYFMNLEPRFAESRDEQGVNRYAGYLRALKAHHGEQPVLVAEFGMSTSRGVAHLQPEGHHHGGQDERAAMRQTARMLQSIYDSRMAGAVVFELMDEWFKSTWSTAEFEIPEEQRPRWFNAESPEQAYGIVASRPVAPVRVDGSPADWQRIPALASQPALASGSGWHVVESLRATSDAGYLYLLLQTGARQREIDWRRTEIVVGLDTYAPERGERVMPGPNGCAAPTAMEFIVHLRGPGQSELRVTPAYQATPSAEADRNPNLPLASPLTPSGRFIAPYITTNRMRITRDGTVVPLRRYNRGELLFGSLDPSAPGFDTRTDVAVGGEDGAIEIRLPWALLNMADPSQRKVLHQPEGAASPQAMATDGFRIYVCARDSAASPRWGDATLLAGFYTWEPWTQPAFVQELKHGVDALTNTFEALPEHPRSRLLTKTGIAP